MRYLCPLPKVYLITLLILFNAVIMDAPNSNAEPPGLNIVRITPAGTDVPAGRQIVLQFNRAVIPLGRMERDAAEIPISISPETDCRWRWLNTSALACQLDEAAALKPATRYDMVIAPGIESEDGATLSKTVKHSFVTERPTVRHAWFRTWRSPGMPVMRLTFNQPVSRRSVEKHIYMGVDDPNGQRLGLKAEPDPNDRQTPFILPLPGDKKYPLPGADSPVDNSGVEDEKLTANIEIAVRRIWLVSPVGELAPDTKVALKVEPGLVSVSGPEPGAENRVLTTIHSFPEFSFQGVECTDNRDEKITLRTIGSGLDPGTRCNPLHSAALIFTAPVIDEAVKEYVTITPDLAGNRKDYDPWANRRGYSRLNSPHKRGRKYRVQLPEVLKAYQVYSIQSDPDKFQDEFGRTLRLPIDLKFATDHRPPNYTLTHPRAVLEKNVDTELPIVVTNLEKITVAYDRLTAKGMQAGQNSELQIPPAEDIAFRTPLKVRDMLAGQSGIIRGEIGSRPPVSKHPGERWFFAQVTPFQVHVKVGHYNTLVWVTEFKTGQPVADATVKIFRGTYKGLGGQADILSRAVTDRAGVAMLAGTRKIDPNLEFIHTYKMTEPRLFAKIEKTDDLALVPLDFQFQVDTYRASRYSVSPFMRPRYGHIHTWGTTAQGVYKAGDTIQYKLYVRDQDNEVFVPAPRHGYTLDVIDPTGKIVHSVDEIFLSNFGSHNGEFTVSRTGAVGWYRFQLKADFSEEIWQPLQVLISDFTPAPFKVSTDLNGQIFQPGESVEAATRARLHSGGPYTDAGTRVTTTLEARPFRSQDPSTRGFQFNTYVAGTPGKQIVHQIEDVLDNRGNLTTGFTLVESKILYGRLVVEGAVRDDRGKHITGRATADYAGRDRFVGLRSTDWVVDEDKPASVDLLVVDGSGNPCEGVSIQVIVERRETKAARVKGAGNAYLTHYTHQWVEVAQCQLKSALVPVQCDLTPQDPGSHRITATIHDTRNRPHNSEIHQWVVGKGRVVWPERPDNSLEIVAEKAQYGVGETARYLVKNPFPGARALITIERYGVLQSWLETLTSDTAIIEFEIKEEFLPGIFLSVVVVSPRVELALSDNQVDLGKPAFRMGYVKVPVTDSQKALAVKVEPRRDIYKPREKVSVEIKATSGQPADGEPIELAVAVLDEAVFDLLLNGRDYFDPYKGFYTVDELDLLNYSLLTRLVGRQKFEKKGVNTGGGGGLDISLRSVFKFVAYWNPSIITDTQGRATIEFEAPDNLTGWRVLAMAVTPGDRMGLGEGHFKVNRPTEIRPVMPNQVTEGDRFEAGFNIMNRTPQKRQLTLTLAAEGVIETAAGKKNRQATRVLDLEPFQRTTVWLPLKTTRGGTIKLTAQGGDALDRDGIVHTIGVQKRFRLETAATYGSTVAPTVSERMLFPRDIRTDVGQVSLILSPSVSGNLEGAFRYLRDYRYTCWEQVLSRGVMASHYNNLKPYLAEDFSWQDSKKLPQLTLTKAAEYQAPNGGMTYFIPRDRNASPYLSAYTALAFNWLRKSGFEIPTAVEEKLHDYLLRMLRRNVMPDFYTKGMSATVRAVALAALVDHEKINLSDLQRYQSHVMQMSLFGKAHFLLAALGVARSDAIRVEVANLILSHANQSGGKFVFSEVIDGGYTRILASPLRTNGAILSALTAYGRTDQGRQMAGAIPFKLVRYITQSRKNRDHWENTQENLFCMNALIDFSRVYESEAPELTLRVLMDGELMGRAEFTDLRDDPVALQRPLVAGDPGRSATIQLHREGQGRLYYNARLSYAPLTPKTESINAGIEIHHEYSLERNNQREILKSPMHLNRGDLVRVDLFVSLPAAGNFVVVDDPIPGGLEPVNRDLATASRVDADKSVFTPAENSWWFRHSDWSSYGVSRWSFYHQELRHNSARFYSEYLPAGNYHLSYMAQAIAPGDFVVRPAYAEEMYDPDVFGKGVAGALVVSR
jgi:alpha-2-macroglobulin